MKGLMKGSISIGAHYGEEYEEWLSLGAKNFIFFEPVKANFIKLERIMKGKPGVTLFNKALGNKVGKIRMFTETEHQGKSCSILEPKIHLTQYPDIEFNTTEIVSINKLDNIAYNRELYDHLHIDTQGYELEVLKGALQSLDYITTITCEVYKEELYAGCSMLHEVQDLLYENLFDLIGVAWCGLTWGNAKFEKR